VFGVEPAAPLLSFLPILVIGVLFGLSMDYEMFLVTGMREQHAHGAEAHTAVVAGFGQGARVVTAAALIMIGVFGNGTFTGGPTIKAIAFALAVGVLMDAFVVRMTLVPAAMMLFGRAAWWFPRWLERATPHVDIEGSAVRHLAEPVRAAGAIGGIPDVPPAEIPVGRKSQLHTAGRDAGQM
jgi:RND superfamily putative drug exporter